MKITEDGFVWKTLSKEQAEKEFNDGALELFVVRDDDSDGEITELEQVEEAFDHGQQIGIEVGHLPDTFITIEKAIEAFRTLIANSSVQSIREDEEFSAEYYAREFSWIINQK